MASDCGSHWHSIFTYRGSEKTGWTEWTGVCVSKMKEPAEGRGKEWAEGNVASGQQLSFVVLRVLRICARGDWKVRLVRAWGGMRERGAGVAATADRVGLSDERA